MIYDNSAVLSFSTSMFTDGTDPGLSWVSFPQGNTQVAMHTLAISDDPTTIGDDAGYYNGPGPGYYTNTQGSVAGDSRYPYNIPRPGRCCWFDYSAVKFDLASTATEFGVFVAANANSGATDGTQTDNYKQFTKTLDIYVFHPGDTIATAEYTQVNVSGYAPFIKIDDAAGISSVQILQNIDSTSGDTFGFFDVYSNVPEPATLSVLALGAMSLIRRRK